MTELISARLRRRIRERGSEPFVTYYDLGTGERTELSGITFGNWVDKTSGLLVDELMVDPGDRVDLAVAQDHPGHWVSLVWTLACWQVGATVTIDRAASARLVVSGPGWTSYAAASELVACSLHPLGLGFSEVLPPTVVDYSLEVRAQPDSYAALPQSGLALAWLDSDRQLSQADLVAGELSADPAQRVLVRAGDAWSTTQAALVRPLLTGGSAVIVVGSDPARLARIADDERISTYAP